jgi:hypothetical protein
MICTNWRVSHPADDLSIVSNKVSATSDIVAHADAGIE